MAEQRLLVIDADVDNRVATELKARGRAAAAVSELELHRVKDVPLLRGLVEHCGTPSRWVLVTGDDAMPDDHGDVLAELRVTLATIDPRRPTGTEEAEWRKDVIHRWAMRWDCRSLARFAAIRRVDTESGVLVALDAAADARVGVALALEAFHARSRGGAAPLGRASRRDSRACLPRRARPAGPADELAAALLARIRDERDMSGSATGRRRKTVRP